MLSENLKPYKIKAKEIWAVKQNQHGIIHKYDLPVSNIDALHQACPKMSRKQLSSK